MGSLSTVTQVGIEAIVPATGIELTLQTLLRSANPLATELLLVALESSDSTLRVGAVRALAMRDDAVGHRGLVERFSGLGADARAALIDVSQRAPLAAALQAMVRPETPNLARRATELAVAWGITPALAAIAEAVSWPENRFATSFSEAALSLAQLLEEQVREHDPAKRSGGEDPAFARRAAVNALALAVDRFDRHRSAHLLEALLLLTPSDEPALLRVLRNEAHAAHETLLAALQSSTSRGALRVLAQVLADPNSPRRLLEIAAARSDTAGLAQLLEHVGYPVGLRLRENCQRIKTFAWLDPELVPRVVELPSNAQATAITIAAASQAKRQRVAELIQLLLVGGEPEAMVAACRAIESLPPDIAVEPLLVAINSTNAAVVACAAAMLRPKDYPQALRALVGLLDHADERVRGAAQKGLRELSFVWFRDNRHELPDPMQSQVGRLVGKADPLVVPSIESELNAGASSRRLAALELAELMGIVEDLADPLAECVLSDPDVGVRAEAARLLGNVGTLPSVLEALQEATGDRSSAVRKAASRSLEKLGTGPALAAEVI